MINVATISVPTISVTSTDPTIHNGEPFTINESDFDPAQHKRVEDVQADSEAGKVAGKAKK